MPAKVSERRSQKTRNRTLAAGQPSSRPVVAQFNVYCHEGLFVNNNTSTCPTRRCKRLQSGWGHWNSIQSSAPGSNTDCANAASGEADPRSKLHFRASGVSTTHFNWLPFDEMATDLKILWCDCSVDIEGSFGLSQFGIGLTHLE